MHPLSERSRTEPERTVLLRQLLAEEAFYQALFEGSADPILVADGAGRYLDSNAAVSELLGYSKDELRQIGSGEFTISADPERGRQEYEQLRRSGAWRGDLDLRAKDGTIIPVEAHVRAIELPAGRVYLGTWRDVRPRLLAERERAHLATIVEASDDAIISETLDGVITSWNPGAERLYGYAPDEAIGQSRAIIIPPDRQADLGAMLARLGRGERIEPFETVRRRKDGTLVDVSVSMSPLRDSQGRIIGASGIGRDITQRRTVERLQQEFISLVSHELRSPVTAIKGYAQLLQQRGVSDERAVQVIVDRSDQLARLITDLMEASNLRSGHLDLRRREVDLLGVVAGSLERARVLSDRHHFRLEAGAEQLIGFWDPERLDQVLTNLLTNAIKYTPAGGEVVVRVERRGNEAAIAIRDPGIGIAPDQLPKLFDRFHRASSAASRAGGLGIGLYVARELVTAHGGRIWAESPGPGLGATFFCTLPLAVAADQAALATGGPVLVVEDDQPLRQLIADTLDEAGFQVRTARDGLEGLELLAAESPALILLDWMMPRMDGEAFATALRARGPVPVPPIIVMTAGGDAAERARRVGAVGFIGKPFDLDLLVDQVRRHLRPVAPSPSDASP